VVPHSYPEDRLPIVNVWTGIAREVGLVTLVLEEEGQVVVVGDGDCKWDLGFFLRIVVTSGSVIFLGLISLFYLLKCF
jgi:hypothetical protein